MRWNSLSARILVSSAVVILVAVVTIILFSNFQAKAALEEVLKSHGKNLLGTMESHAADYILQHEYVYLRNYVTEITRKEPVLSYAAMANAEGVIFAHSRHSLEGNKMEVPVESASGPHPGISARESRFDGNRVYVLTAPVVVAERTVGTIQIGVNYKQVDAVLRKLVLVVGIAGGVILCLAVLCVRVFTGNVTSGITQFSESAGKVAEGDLRIQIAEEGYEEIRTLARAFNTMASNLRGTVRQVQEAGEKAGKFSSNVISLIQEQATNATQEAASISEITATVSELSRTSQQIAQSAEAVKETATKTVDMAQKGNVLVREGGEATNRIRMRVSDIAQKTLFLGEKSHEIGKVMDIIQEIASEIHLLALNAAIESAAAGEFGRRFSVVASEVRRLAEKTRESTDTIRTIISEIKAATDTSIQATEQGMVEVNKWKDTIALSINAFEEIILGIEKTSEASTQISLATHQQTSANEQVVQAMHQVAETVQSTAAKMKGTSASAGEMKEMLERMRLMTEVFEV